MLRYRDAYKDTPEHCVVTFTAYSLHSVLGLCNAGFTMTAGVTTAKFNGLMLCNREAAKRGSYAYMMEKTA